AQKAQSALQCAAKSRESCYFHDERWASLRPPIGSQAAIPPQSISLTASGAALASVFPEARITEPFPGETRAMDGVLTELVTSMRRAALAAVAAAAIALPASTAALAR